MKHRRVSNKRMKQLLAEVGIGQDNHENEEQALLEKKQQSVNPDKQLINIDSQNK
ncbi:hypothetical protein [Photobacterium sanguinicancri]|uniref:Uncharacterized protein n=1 Tax=Photobacterium sanguinicancri TaxID=875932 RepID=A0AAW7Y304_9GAMM|nr:hypothetical protein [Photobacterium sanguinicancri]MDO6497301.1 hypothetical protein [Photobacterium sanguinicancri]MDO6541030.1 hypothetical protein [Photobacterium sanguinicancri]